MASLLLRLGYCQGMTLVAAVFAAHDAEKEVSLGDSNRRQTARPMSASRASCGA